MSGFPVVAAHHKRPAWFWRVIILGMPLALGFGTIGFWVYEHKPGGVTPWLNALYYSFQLFILHVPHLDSPINVWLELGRWMAAGIFGMAAMMALYSILVTEAQHLRLRFEKKHTVICGIDPGALRLADCLKRKHHHIVIIAQAASEDEVMSAQEAGAIIMLGNPADPANLMKARLQHARQLIALCDDDDKNVQIAVEAAKALRDLNKRHNSEPLNCFVQLADVDLRASLHRTASVADQHCRVRFFDLFDAAARRLLLEPVHLPSNPLQRPIDHGGIGPDETRQVHLVILGFGQMGRTIAVRAAQLGHFANGKQIHISVIDRDATRHEQSLLFRYPAFSKACHIEFHHLEVESKQALELLHRCCADKGSATSIVLSFDQDSLALEVALRLFPLVKEFDIPVAVRMSHKSGFASLLEEGVARQNLRFHLRGFGMVEDFCNGDVLDDPVNESLARTIHEEFRRKRLQEGRDPSSRSILPWSDLDDDFKDSNRQQADHMAIKLQGIGCVRAPVDDPRPAVERFEDSEVEIMAKMEHCRWISERLLSGGIAESKHDRSNDPCPSVPWMQLSNNYKEYNREIVRLIPTLLSGIGEKACRKVN